jgi:hypothetical protein
MEVPCIDVFNCKNLFSREWVRSLAGALLLISLAFVCQHVATEYALSYAERPTSVYVGDIVLDNLPVIDLSFIIIELALFAIVIGTSFVIFYRPRYILFTIKAIALFIAIRALFMSLTHMGIYPGHIGPGSGYFDFIYSYFNMQTGFFFSGHTGMPFLMALIFWDKKQERALFLLLSIVFAVAVLFTRIHYSIDVLAAPFMAYGIFKIAKYLFLRDYKLIESGHV